MYIVHWVIKKIIKGKCFEDVILILEAPYVKINIFIYLISKYLWGSVTKCRLYKL